LIRTAFERCSIVYRFSRGAEPAYHSNSSSGHDRLDCAQAKSATVNPWFDRVAAIARLTIRQTIVTVISVRSSKVAKSQHLLSRRVRGIGWHDSTVRLGAAALFIAAIDRGKPPLTLARGPMRKYVEFQASRIAARTLQSLHATFRADCNEFGYLGGHGARRVAGRGPEAFLSARRLRPALEIRLRTNPGQRTVTHTKRL